MSIYCTRFFLLFLEWVKSKVKQFFFLPCFVLTIFIFLFVCTLVYSALAPSPLFVLYLNLLPVMDVLNLVQKEEQSFYRKGKRLLAACLPCFLPCCNPRRWRRCPLSAAKIHLGAKIQARRGAARPGLCRRGPRAGHAPGTLRPPGAVTRRRGRGAPGVRPYSFSSLRLPERWILGSSGARPLAARCRRVWASRSR